MNDSGSNRFRQAVAELAVETGTPVTGVTRIFGCEAIRDPMRIVELCLRHEALAAENGFESD